MIEPRNPGSSVGVTGDWLLHGAESHCRLNLNDLEAQARAGGDEPPPMRGAILEDRCGLVRAVAGWRMTSDGAIELADPYGQPVIVLYPDDEGGFEARDRSIQLRRP